MPPSKNRHSYLFRTRTNTQYSTGFSAFGIYLTAKRINTAKRIKIQSVEIANFFGFPIAFMTSEVSKRSTGDRFLSSRNRYNNWLRYIDTCERRAVGKW